LLLRIANEIQNILQKNNRSERDVQKVNFLLNTLNNLVPFLLEDILLKSPFAKLYEKEENNNHRMQYLKEDFNKFVQTQNYLNSSWNEMQWLLDFILTIIKFVCLIDPLEDNIIIFSFITLLSTICSHFGNIFTRIIVKSPLEKEIDESKGILFYFILLNINFIRWNEKE
jgi:hypothetical protein